MTRPPGLTATPLLDLIVQRAAEAGRTRKAFVVERLGAAVERNWWRWVRGQTVSCDTADRICHLLGVHPTSVWPEWGTPPPNRRAHATTQA